MNPQNNRPSKTTEGKDLWLSGIRVNNAAQLYVWFDSQQTKFRCPLLNKMWSEMKSVALNKKQENFTKGQISMWLWIGRWPFQDTIDTPLGQTIM